MVSAHSCSHNMDCLLHIPAARHAHCMHLGAVLAKEETSDTGRTVNQCPLPLGCLHSPNICQPGTSFTETLYVAPFVETVECRWGTFFKRVLG